MSHEVSGPFGATSLTDYGISTSPCQTPYRTQGPKGVSGPRTYLGRDLSLLIVGTNSRSRVISKGVKPFVTISSLHQDTVTNSKPRVTFRRDLTLCYRPVAKVGRCRKYEVTSDIQKRVLSFVTVPLLNQDHVPKSRSWMIFSRWLVLLCCPVQIQDYDFSFPDCGYSLWTFLIFSIDREVYTSVVVFLRS